MELKPKVTISETKSDGWRGLEHNVSEADMAWLQKCYVGQVPNPDDVITLQDKLFAEGFLSVRVLIMGGIRC